MRFVTFMLCIAMVACTAGFSAVADEQRDDSPKIVNIINFIRAVEPRLEMDLYQPVVEQIKLLKQYDMPGTFLVQYDVMIEPRFVSLLKSELDDRHEIGGWFEVVQPMVEDAGLEWRGRYPWDWHSDVGFSVGYSPKEREKLVDVYMAKFKETFGYLPKSIGSWFMDAHTLAYMADEYGVMASCNCKDQIGTDGYTLWGGYWNQAFYPSRKNALMPAQTEEQQIPLPVFRMLGSDPIYQYDRNLGSSHQSVVTLEPVYWNGGAGGGDPQWVRWFFKELTEQPCLAFGYTQVGQENSFGWARMGKGLTDQFAILNELENEGKVRVETLADSGKWFAKRYPLTPPTTVIALNDWKKEGRKSVWYNSRFYRVNIAWEQDTMRIRDIHLFDENYPERYLTEKVTTNQCRYDTLPVLDGFSWSTQESIAGIRPVALDGSPLSGGEPVIEQRGDTQLLIKWPLTQGGTLEMLLQPSVMTFNLTGDSEIDWALAMNWSPNKTPAIDRVTDDAIQYVHNGYNYTLRCKAGRFSAELAQHRIQLIPSEKKIVLELAPEVKSTNTSQGSTMPIADTFFRYCDHQASAATIAMPGSLSGNQTYCQVSEVETPVKTMPLKDAAGQLTIAQSKRCKLFLLGGQSNMDGCGRGEELPESYQTHPANVITWDNRKQCWVPLTKDSMAIARHQQFGPEIAFAHHLAKAFPEEVIAIMKTSAGGTKLHTQWLPGKGMYQAFIRNFNGATKNLQESGIEYEIGGMLWMQGESDSETTEMANAYEENLKQMIADVRVQTKNPALPIVMGRISSSLLKPTPWNFDHTKIVQAAQEAVAAEDDHVHIINTDQLSTLKDNTHFDTKAQLALGNQMADVMLGELVELNDK